MRRKRVLTVATSYFGSFLLPTGRLTYRIPSEEKRLNLLSSLHRIRPNHLEGVVTYAFFLKYYSVALSSIAQSGLHWFFFIEVIMLPLEVYAEILRWLDRRQLQMAVRPTCSMLNRLVGVYFANSPRGIYDVCIGLNGSVFGAYKMLAFKRGGKYQKLQEKLRASECKGFGIPCVLPEYIVKTIYMDINEIKEIVVPTFVHILCITLVIDDTFAPHHVDALRPLREAFHRAPLIGYIYDVDEISRLKQSRFIRITDTAFLHPTNNSVRKTDDSGQSPAMAALRYLFSGDIFELDEIELSLQVIPQELRLFTLPSIRQCNLLKVHNFVDEAQWVDDDEALPPRPCCTSTEVLEWLLDGLSRDTHRCDNQREFIFQDEPFHQSELWQVDRTIVENYMSLNRNISTPVSFYFICVWPKRCKNTNENQPFLAFDNDPRSEIVFEDSHPTWNKVLSRHYAKPFPYDPIGFLYLDYYRYISYTYSTKRS